MQIEEKKLCEFVLWIIDLFYKARTELVAYQVAHLFLAAAGLNQEFDQLLEKARKHPSPALLADHQEARDTIAELLNAGKVDETLEFLRQWKPRGPIQ